MLLLNDVDLVFIDYFLSYIWDFDDPLINYVNVDDLLGVFNLLYWLFDNCFHFYCLGDWFIDCLPAGSNNNDWLVNWNINVLLADVNDSLGNIDFFNSFGVFNFLVELVNDLLGHNNLISCHWDLFDHISDGLSGVRDIDVFVSSVYDDILLDDDDFFVDILDDWFDYCFDHWYVNEPLGVDDLLHVPLNGVLNWGCDFVDGDLWYYHDLVGVVDLNNGLFNFLGHFDNLDILDINFNNDLLLLNSVIVDGLLNLLLNFNYFDSTWFLHWYINGCFDNLHGLDNHFLFHGNLDDFDGLDGLVFGRHNFLDNLVFDSHVNVIIFLDDFEVFNILFNVVFDNEFFNDNFLDDLGNFNNLNFFDFYNFFNYDCDNLLDWLLNNLDMLNDLNFCLFDFLWNNFVLVDDGLNNLIDLYNFLYNLFNLVDDEFLDWNLNNDITLNDSLLDDWSFHNLDLLNYLLFWHLDNVLNINKLDGWSLNSLLHDDLLDNFNIIVFDNFIFLHNFHNLNDLHSLRYFNFPNLDFFNIYIFNSFVNFHYLFLNFSCFHVFNFHDSFRDHVNFFNLSHFGDHINWNFFDFLNLLEDFLSDNAGIQVSLGFFLSNLNLLDGFPDKELLSLDFSTLLFITIFHAFTIVNEIVTDHVAEVFNGTGYSFQLTCNWFQCTQL